MTTALTPTGIRRLQTVEAKHIRELSDVLIDCVDHGASVSFMAPLERAAADAFWQKIARDVALGSRVLLVAEDASEQIVGTVQLVLDTPPNQPHRADVAKMLVRSDARRRGLGEQLLRALEHEAERAGRHVLVLDTVTGEAGERLYARLGWTRVGEIPNYALWPHGGYCSTTFFYKTL
jgi:ribosomal protein S18 acetylase RimI-like enzyme